jgi:GAF domain-containing protein
LCFKRDYCSGASEFKENYFVKYNIQSLLDLPISVNGKLTGLICFETTKTKINWDNDDIILPEQFLI